MIDILYYIFIFPLESVLGVVLDLLHLLTKNYGLSIIILSLLVNLFLLKLAKIAESKATKINTLKSTCDSKITEFKRAFKGAELQSYIRTLYKQKHYHPIFALSALGGLALQVPFFIAVLCLLQEFDGIKGVSFLWISDLSLPDSVFGIHLLPILMTIISLINVWIVAKEKSALIQGGLISLIFLVLLYAMPSALVLYWSTNMAFSLIRALWSKWCGNSLLGMRFRRFAKSPQGTDTKSAILVSIRQKLQKPHRNNFDCVKGESNNNLSLRGDFSPKQSINHKDIDDCFASLTNSANCHESANADSRNDGVISPSLARGDSAKDSPSLAEGVRGWVNSTQCTKSHNNKTNFFIHPKPIKIAVIALTSILALGLCITFALMLYAKDNVQTAPITLDSLDSARIHFGKWDFLLRSSSISNVKLVRVEWDSAIDSNNIKVTSNAKRYLHFETTRFLDLDKGTNLGQISYKMNLTPLLKNILLYYAIILGAILGIYLLLCIIERFQRYEPQNAKIYRQISIYAIVCIAFLICVFTPYQLYSTDITQFDSTQTYVTLSALFGAFVLINFMMIYVLSFVPKRFSNIVAFVLSVILFSGIVYSFILVGDYGAMDRFILQKAPKKSTGQIFEFIVVLLLGIALMTFALKKLKIAMQIILATLFIVSGVNALQIVNKRMETNVSSLREGVDSDKSKQSATISSLEESETNKAIQNNKNGLPRLTSKSRNDSIDSPSLVRGDKGDGYDSIKPPYADSPLFSYSKTEKNIVVLVLDAFSGSHTPYILKQFPQFKTQLDGFTLFPNAISSASSTIISITSLIAGEYYAGYNVNKRQKPLQDSINEGFLRIGEHFADNGYNVGIYTTLTWMNGYELFKSPKFFNVDNENLFIDFFIANNKDELQGVDLPKNAESLRLLQFGLFRFVPNRFKAKIYNNGNWLIDILGANLMGVIQHASDAYTFTHTGNIDSAKSTFKFFHSVITHTPYGLYFKDGKCRFGEQKSAWEDYPHNVEMRESKAGALYQHYDTEACSLSYLADYIAWLKNVGIYDNTQIFVISDHGLGNPINISLPNTKNPNPDSLLLFKDFGAKGNLKIDNRLMANYDITSIFCENLPNGCPNVPPNILQNYPKSRTLKWLKNTYWELHKQHKNEWLIEKAYKVKDNIYDEKNWTDISDESYGIVNVK